MFTGIDVLGVAPSYRKEGNYMLFGFGYDIVNVMLETNNCLYALMPGKKAVDPTTPQPAGFPKAGREVSR